MTLTEGDFYREACFLKIPCESFEMADKLKLEILKNQEYAEKYISMRKDDSCGTLYEGYEKYIQLKERLEKRLEECETNSNKISAKDDWVEYKFQMRLVPELKKLMESDKDVHEYEDCPDPYNCDIHIGIGGNNETN